MVLICLYVDMFYAIIFTICCIYIHVYIFGSTQSTVPVVKIIHVVVHIGQGGGKTSHCQNQPGSDVDNIQTVKIFFSLLHPESGGLFQYFIASCYVLVCLLYLLNSLLHFL